MNSSRLPSGSRTYTLDDAFCRPASRGTGPSNALIPLLSSIALCCSGVPPCLAHRAYTELIWTKLQFNCMFPR
jgi:hypothetical protein